MRQKKYLIEIIVFICGASGMVLELVGSRILSPFFGNSLIVWTSLIGVMLGFMSLGYFIGGKLADKKLTSLILFWIIILASFFIGIIGFVEFAFLPGLAVIGHQGLFSLISSVLLFACPSTLLGMVSPYSVRLKMSDLKSSGETVGTLYAISTVGSIVGTFLSGFVLISYFGCHIILSILSLVLLLLSFLVIGKLNFKKVFLAILILALNFSFFIVKEDKNTVSIDTQYDRYFIITAKDDQTSRQVIYLSRDHNSAESAVYADNGDPYMFSYYKYYDIADVLVPTNQKTLLVGGGAFVYPRHYLKNHPNSKMDIVEIDPQLLEISKKYFFFNENQNLNINVQDGRTFLNNATESYNIIYLDAFKSFTSVPYQLTTQESMKKCYDLLDKNGVLVMNIIASINGNRSKFLSAEYKTLESVFPNVAIFAAIDKNDKKMTQNISLIATKNASLDIYTAVTENYPEMAKSIVFGYVPSDHVKVLTDDFSPTDQYLLDI